MYFLCMRIYVCMHPCVIIRICMHTYMCIYEQIYACVYMCMRICAYVCTHTHVPSGALHTYAYVCLYARKHLHWRFAQQKMSKKPACNNMPSITLHAHTRFGTLYNQWLDHSRFAHVKNIRNDSASTLTSSLMPCLRRSKLHLVSTCNPDAGLYMYTHTLL